MSVEMQCCNAVTALAVTATTRKLACE